MSEIYREKSSGTLLLLLKGAPEGVLNLCNRYCASFM
jgi:hypothetical protein